MNEIERLEIIKEAQQTITLMSAEIERLAKKITIVQMILENHGCSEKDCSLCHLKKEMEK